MTPAIVIISYNRPNSLERLLLSIDNAIYESEQIELVISIDYQDSTLHEKVVEIATNFIWKQGTKRVLIHKVNMGLRRHVLSCGDLTKEFGSIIMLEDDLVVGPGFYEFAKSSLNYYSKDDNIGGISLYNHRLNFCNRLPFELIPDFSSDIYFLQIASSWGQAWDSRQWNSFKHWYDQGPIISLNDKLPAAVREWPESSWLKYFIKYLVENNKYFVYPKLSFSSNFGDSGTHNLESDTTFQVPISATNSTPRLQEFIDSINVYDSFFELEERILRKFKTSLPNESILVDLYGLKDVSLYTSKYVLSSKKSNIPVISSFGLSLKPMVANILNNVNGNYFGLHERTSVLNQKSNLSLNSTEWTYFYGRLNLKQILKVIADNLQRKFSKKFKL